MATVLVDRDTVNDDVVIVRKLYQSTGEHIAAGTLILEYETSKTSVESHAPESGVLLLAVNEGDEVAIGGQLYAVTPDTDVAPDAAPLTATNGGHASHGVERLLSRQAQQLVSALAIDADSLPASGWITASDLRALAESRSPTERAPRLDAPAGDTRLLPHRLQKASLRKRTEARRLMQANAHGATSMLGMTVPIGGERLVRPPALFLDSISDIVIFETARLLRLHPELNSSYVDERRVALYDQVNVGVSFDSGANLKVLAIRNADAQTLAAIQHEFAQLLDRYESGEPIDEDLLSSSTVTVSDLSGTSVSFMQPLVNGQQCLIIGITRAPGGFGLHASFDHRVTEGLEVARFLQQLASRLASHFADRPETARQCCTVCERTLDEELALGHRGLIRMALPAGHDGLMCRSCFEGF